MTEGIVVVDHNMNITHVNPAVYRLFGIDDIDTTTGSLEEENDKDEQLNVSMTKYHPDLKDIFPNEYKMITVLF